jgi:hypothetical protein
MWILVTCQLDLESVTLEPHLRRLRTEATYSGRDATFYPVSGSGFQSSFDDLRSRLSLLFSVVEGGLFSGSEQMKQNANAIAGAMKAGDNAVQ